jgi:hypothetical protein
MSSTKGNKGTKNSGTKSNSSTNNSRKYYYGISKGTKAINRPK